MSLLHKKQCKPCEGGVAPLSSQEAAKFQKEVANWELNHDHSMLTLSLSCDNFYDVMSAVNGIACIVNQEDHHPDITLGYNYCSIAFTTHAVKGLSENDFICAYKINQLLDLNE